VLRGVENLHEAKAAIEMSELGAVTIGVIYSCEGCGLRNVSLDVPARTEQETVTTWMDATVRRLSADHRRRSPLCRAKALQEVKIPITGTQRIGGPKVQ
jgi:hypothetical protein